MDLSNFFCPRYCLSQKETFGFFFIICIFSILAVLGCSNGNESIKCVTKYLEMKIDGNQLNRFIELEGKQIYLEWGDLTSPLGYDYFVIEDCGIHKYVAENEEYLDSLKGHMFFVYSVHSYLRNGYVNQGNIKSKVNDLYSEILNE